MRRLITFGCSHTYGMGLSDCYNRITKFAGDNPSKFSWPQLSDRLKIECVNLSRPGNSNKSIWNDIMSFQFDKTDIVIVMWTHVSRWCIIQNDEVEDIAHYMDTPKTKEYYKSYYDKTDSNIDLNLRMSHVSLHLSKNDIVNYHTIYKPSDYQPLDFNLTTVLDIASLNTLKSKYPKGVDNKHPGEQAHLEFANNLYEHLKESL